MDSFELNKMAGALLGTVLFVLVLMNLSDLLFHQDIPETPGYIVEVADAGGEATAEAEEEAVPLPVLLASADAASGEKVAKKCAACHTFDNGGANKVGPNLWNIVNRTPGAVGDFKYSGPMSEMGATHTWGFTELDEFLANPKGYVAGTAMAFAGVKKPEDRADLLAYLRTLSDSPAPLPEAEAAPAEEAPAEGAEPAATEN